MAMLQSLVPATKELYLIEDWKALKAYIDKHGKGGGVGADPDMHENVMMTDRGAVLTKGVRMPYLPPVLSILETSL